MTEISPMRAAYEQIKNINTAPRRTIMQDERDVLETRRASLSIDIVNLNSEISSLEVLRDELNRAIDVKRDIRTETVATYESATTTLADLEIQIKRMESK